ncbi:MAG TPA: phosphonate metabolism protein/1,5-bisphosphokinase (PRPP-forming) PhnN [Burkholderiales bacterium]|nr:phosphonate metabolism protein/1,5-bisphosphokinase (PRPP-forming) PhnN [Burkholderiales bacterium]
MRHRLFYVVGASGVGKDSLIAYARERLATSRAIVFAHRYITRPAECGRENHIELSCAEFAQRERLGLFAMSWESHGYRYGIGVEIDAWLAQGLSVVVNGSRDYVPQVRRRYPDIGVVWVSAPPEVVESRLQSRGRESSREIEARLERNSRLGVEAPDDVLRIDNDGTLETAGERLIALLSS